VLSGFKSVNGLIFSFAGGAFMAETVMPGVVMNTDNGPYFIILIGLFIFALPRKNYQTTAYSYGNAQKSHSKDKSHSRRSRSHTSSLADIEKNKDQSPSDSI
jgi:hypothetical protein